MKTFIRITSLIMALLLIGGTLLTLFSITAYAGSWGGSAGNTLVLYSSQVELDTDSVYMKDSYGDSPNTWEHLSGLDNGTDFIVNGSGKKYRFTLTLTFNDGDMKKDGATVIDLSKFEENVSFSSSGSFSTSSNDSIKVESVSGNSITITFSDVVYSRYDDNMHLRYESGNKNYIIQIPIPQEYLRLVSGNSGNDSSDSDTTWSAILKPRMMVASYETSGNPAQDSTFTLSVRYRAISEITLKNIVMTVTPPAGVTLVGSSNRVYVDKMSEVSSRTNSFQFYVGEDYKDKTAAFEITFDFQYAWNEDYQDSSSTETIVIPITIPDEETAEDRFEISYVEFPQSLYENEEGYITVTVINKGKESASNVSVTIVGDALQNNGYSEYYGAVASNTKAEIEVPVISSMAGEHSCRILVQYEDPDENLKELQREFTLNVIEMYDPTDPGEDPWPVDPMPPEEEDGFSMVLLFSIIGGAIVAIVVVVMVAKRLKARRDEIDDEDF